MQGRLDRTDIAIEVALEDPGVFLSSPQALKNLDTSVRDLTGVCDHLVGHMGMIHHTVKENGMHPGTSGLFRVAKANVEPVRQRTQYSCMAASMTMCLKALGYDSLDEDQVNRVMGAQPMKGAAWEQALACAQHYGCRATLTMPATVEQLKAWTDAGIPIMIAWNPEGRPWSHASVVFDVDDDLNVYVADPNIPNPKETVRIVPEAEFYGKWYEKFPDYLVRRPACAIEREITLDGKQVNILAGEQQQPVATKLLASRTASQKTATFHTWDNPHESPKGVRYPKSKWDIFGRKSPFRWATPAPNIDGSFPEPWRVADKDAALDLLRKTFPEHRDIYVEYESDLWRGFNRLWVGLRDNRDKAAHQARLQQMWTSLGEQDLWALFDQGRLWLLDDVKKDVLRSRQAKGPTQTTKTQDEKRREQNKVTVPKSTPRNDAARALAEKGNKGQGTHKNKQDFDRGQARQPKHKKPFDREAALIERLAAGIIEKTWQKLPTGWQIVDWDTGVYAFIRAEDQETTIQDRNIPSQNEIADPELLADGIPEYEDAYEEHLREWEQWKKQGWWPRPATVPALHLIILNKPTRHAFEAWFGKSELTKAQTWGLAAIEVIKNRKYPRWMQPLSQDDTPPWLRRLHGSYSGNRVATHADYDEWVSQVPGAEELFSREQKALNAFWNFCKGELVEAVKLDDALETVAWDMGYQGRTLRFAPGLEFLARIRHVNLTKEFQDGQKAGQENKQAAYSGNPDGEPIYPVQVDHGEEHALSGGHDIMKRLQDELRIEQGGSARSNQETRLAARWNANTAGEVGLQIERLARRFQNGGGER